ncbi:hypothetical protein [Nostoc sp. 2RC]|uniref:hypothetical protein n=1 Tax=Nostoc sp. 2RC TaxID=2485484 RepID=UPI00162334B8|nr:hypothetical protein [Nostoc sp. 2RC]MBC1238705.1 hypothetical protein [Nostoc sp. 2RC]
MTIATDSGLWIPPHADELLVVTVDAGASDTDFEGMLLVNQAANDWLRGRLDTGTYFDMLDHVGIDPLNFVTEVEEHVNLLVSHF